MDCHRLRRPLPSLQRAVALVLTVAIGVLGASSAATAQGVRTGSVRIILRATPTTIPADGKSMSRVRIEVRDRSDQPVADGTPVLCTVDNGLLGTSDADKRESLTVTTAGGYATVYCSSETAGAATITVRSQDSRTEVVLQFLPPGEAAQPSARVISIRGGNVGYCLDLGLVRARDGARAQAGNLVFNATEGLELRIADQTLRGWGVSVVRKGETLQGEDFFFDLARGRGVLRRFGDDGVERVPFNAYTLKAASAGGELPDDAFRHDEREGETWLVCDSLLYFPGQKVVVKHAALYVGGQRMFRFPPYWVLGMPGYAGSSNTQSIGASSSGGLAVNLPLFYRVTDTWAGAVRVQRGATGSSVAARDGWSLGIAEEYDTGEAKGSFEASGLLSQDWGVEWRDERSILGGDQGFFTVGWPDHRSLFADASVYHYSTAYRLNLRGQLDSPDGEGDSYRVSADWLTEPRPLSSRAAYRLGVSLGTRSLYAEQNDWTFENELYAALDLRPYQLGDRTRVTPSLTNVYSWDTGDYGSNSARAQLHLAQEFGPSTRLNLNYYLAYRNGDTTQRGADHSLGLDFSFLPAARWNAALNGTWDMTVGNTYGLLSVDFRVRPKWRLGMMATHYDFDETSYNDLEFGLSRSVGEREIGLRYSLENHRLYVEFGGLGLLN